MKQLITISAILLASTATLAQVNIMASLDADKDGRISLEEASSDTSLSKVFTKLDIDQDGYLSESEMTLKVD